MKKLKFLPVVVLVVLSAALCLPALAASPAARPATWAVAVSTQGVANLWRVETDLYRSARPESAGFQELEKLGVKAVLDVESPADEAAAKGTKLKLFHVPMNAFGLRDESVLEAMKILSDPANRPIVIHCQHGADRTGAMMALYRVVVEGWSKDDAIREMNAGGYHHSSWFSNLDRYVAGANVDALRKALGVARPGMTLLAALGKAPTDLATAAANTIVPAVTTATATVKSELKAVESAVAPAATDPKAGVQTASLSTAAASATPEPGSDASRSAAAPASSAPAAGNNR
jgi:protein tyrosine phosphatase (PTP) superfamily phosphohydrolase (DUF442 family)